MPEEILYDMRKSNYPSKRGDTFRTLQVYKCRICGALTNRGHMGGWPGYGFRTICPHATEEWHHEIADRMEFWGRDDTTAQSLLRASTHLVHHDLGGNPDSTQMDEVRSVRAWRQGQVDKRYQRRELYEQERNDLLAKLRTTQARRE